MDLLSYWLLGGLGYYVYLRYYKNVPNEAISPYDLALWFLQPLRLLKRKSN